MKERGVSQRVARITSIDIKKSEILESLRYASSLLKISAERVSIASIVKSEKMMKYKQLISEIKPIVGSFESLKASQDLLIRTLESLNGEVNGCLEKTSAALKSGITMHQDLLSYKAKKQVLEAIFSKLDPGAVENNDNDSVLTTISKRSGIAET